MAQDWGQGGEQHGQGWLGIGAKVVNSMGKTLWLALRRRARMLGSGSGLASSPTHHWDRGVKTWVARHSGKNQAKVLVWVSTWWQQSGLRAGQRGSTRTSVHSDRPIGVWVSEDARTKVSQRGEWLRPSERLPTDLGGVRVRPRGSSWPTLVWAVSLDTWQNGVQGLIKQSGGGYKRLSEAVLCGLTWTCPEGDTWWRLW
ncbi:hypothetical protein TIFTF001_008000 [Ficus carica]|uniref:Uncharacterized protein n=1 Tax=Ficus carica TaxID=3494 RepID=A0AA87ZRJ5_FICCA|nr:hypothetical protein TIFTF001_008000 [Ficus carica]